MKLVPHLQNWSAECPSPTAARSVYTASGIEALSNSAAAAPSSTNLLPVEPDHGNQQVELWISARKSETQLETIALVAVAQFDRSIQTPTLPASSQHKTNLNQDLSKSRRVIAPEVLGDADCKHEYGFAVP